MRPVPVSNPPNPWNATTLEYFDGEVSSTPLQVFEDRTREILSRNDSPDVGFEWSVNPYRGCLHACAYCYARPGHEHLGFGAGTDFDRKIVVKPEAPALLRAALGRPAWRRRRTASGLPLVAFSGVTDCYQPLEASYRLTRGCLAACLEHDTPVAVITKSALVERDLDLLVALARGPGASVCVSLPLLDRDLARALEPLAASPTRRLRALTRLAEAGVPVSVNVAPVIPGLNDAAIPETLAAARAAGATSAGMVLLRLPGPVKQVFEQRLRQALPLRADRVLSLLRQAHDGRLYDARFGHRGTGSGPIAHSISALFDRAARQLGLRTDLAPVAPVPQRAPGARVTSEAPADGPGARPRSPALRPVQLRLL